MTNKVRSIILACYQVENNLRLWRFEKQSFPEHGISKGNHNLDTFLFSWYEHGSVSDDLLDNDIYLTYADPNKLPVIEPVAILTIDDIFNGDYVDWDDTDNSVINSPDKLEEELSGSPGYFKGILMEKLNGLVTDILLVSNNGKCKDSLPNEEWVERSMLLCLARKTGLYYQEYTKVILNEERNRIVATE